MLLLLVMGLGCADAAEQPFTSDEIQGRVTDAVIEFTIGLEEGDSNYVFGSIGGIAVDRRAGRVFIADGRNHEVRAYGTNGVYQFSFGRFGVGPGDVINPCCLAIDRDGRLWVWSAAERSVRYDVFDVTVDRPALLFRVAGADLGQLQLRRILFDASGRLVHVMSITEESADYRPARMIAGPTGGTVLTPETGERHTRIARVELDTTGAELRRVLLPYVPPDSLGMVPLELTFTVADVTYPQRVWLSVPGTARRLVAHAPAGFAEAVSARYVIHWYDREGSLVGITRRDLSGPLRTVEEHAAAEAALQRTREIARAQGGTLPDMPIPRRKHPLDQLFFDVEGRLWVQHTPAASDTLNTADVYLPDRSYLQTVRWPRHVHLTHGSIAGDIAYGVSLDELEVPRLVRLRIPQPPGRH